MSRPFTTLGLSLLIIFLLHASDGYAQNKIEPFQTSQAGAILTRHAAIHCEKDLTEADKNFIVRTFSGFEGKVISCTSSPASQFIDIRYSENLKERDLLEVLQMNGYPSFLMKGDHIKVVLTVNGEAREELVK